VIAVSPLPGTGVDIDKTPSNIQTLSSSDLARNGAPSVIGALDSQLGSLNINDDLDDPYQPNILLRGFEASPVLGTPQGVAVYENGARINEAFGETVNWDLIPDLAVRRLDVFLRAEFELADDFDLYHRLLALGDIARLDEPLTVYRWHAHNTTYGNEDRQNANAVKVLRTAYAGWLGADAETAARLVVRHLSDRKPVHGAATLEQLGCCLERLLDGFCAAHCGASADRQRIRAVGGEIWWRTVRASVRAGAPGLLGQYRRRPGLAADFRPPPVDQMASLAIGVVRSGRRRAASPG